MQIIIIISLEFLSTHEYSKDTGKAIGAQKYLLLYEFEYLSNYNNAPAQV